MRLKPTILIPLLIALLSGGCAQWKEEAMEEPEVYRDPVTGETRYQKDRDSMTLWESD